jgi:subtilisin family serine protease
MTRRVGVPMVLVTGSILLSVGLEAGRRAGAHPTGAATGSDDLGCGTPVLMDPPPGLVITAGVGRGVGGAGPVDPEADRLTGQWIVQFEDGAGVDDPAAFATELGLTLEVEHGLSRPRRGGRPDPLARTWTVRGGPEVLERLGDAPGVAWVEPLYRTHAAGAPNDPYYGFQWNLSSLAVPDSWDTSRGRGVVVAVLDTGVSSGPDGLGLLLDGYDFVDRDPDPSDSGWHGTHVSGVVAQVTDNGEGVASFAPSAAILPVRVLGESGGNTADLAEGIVWAVDEGADIINLSLGTSGESELVLDALAYAEAEGVVVVAASGNESYSDFILFPASVDTVLAVGATLLDGSIARYSNQGPGLDLVAPAGTLDADTDGDGLPDAVLQEAWLDGDWGYVVAEGTSIATPHVAAAAALLLGARDLDPATVRDILRDTAIDLGGTGTDVTFGAGLVDPVAALASLGVDGSSADDADDADGVAGGGGVGVNPSTGDTVLLGSQDASTLGCGG